ncbi:hypothetical protein [Pseudidiomarina salilacus]|uniref:hypothetical protein n=1 Tax=Pseudidiomarina salilacus TaxID=3384452 RepID=UPI003984C46F
MMVFALTEQGQERTHVDDATKATRYVCALCKSSVSVVKGEHKRHHYRHRVGRKSGGSNGETDLHRAAKEIIQASRSLVFPNNKFITFDHVDVEVTLNKQIKADLIGYIGQRRCVIEIRVTHAVNRQKIEIIESLNVDTIELDLSSWHRSCPSLASRVGIEQVINLYAPRKWLVRHRRFPRLYRFWHSAKSWLRQLTHPRLPTTRAPCQLRLPL